MNNCTLHMMVANGVFVGCFCNLLQLQLRIHQIVVIEIAQKDAVFQSGKYLLSITIYSPKILSVISKFLELKVLIL